MVKRQKQKQKQKQSQRQTVNINLGTTKKRKYTKRPRKPPPEAPRGQLPLPPPFPPSLPPYWPYAPQSVPTSAGLVPTPAPIATPANIAIPAPIAIPTPAPFIPATAPTASLLSAVPSPTPAIQFQDIRKRDEIDPYTTLLTRPPATVLRALRIQAFPENTVAQLAGEDPFRPSPIVTDVPVPRILLPRVEPVRPEPIDEDVFVEAEGELNPQFFPLVEEEQPRRVEGTEALVTPQPPVGSAESLTSGITVGVRPFGQETGGPRLPYTLVEEQLPEVSLPAFEEYIPKSNPFVSERGFATASLTPSSLFYRKEIRQQQVKERKAQQSERVLFGAEDVPAPAQFVAPVQEPLVPEVTPRKRRTKQQISEAYGMGAEDVRSIEKAEQKSARKAQRAVETVDRVFGSVKPLGTAPSYWQTQPEVNVLLAKAQKGKKKESLEKQKQGDSSTEDEYRWQGE